MSKVRHLYESSGDLEKVRKNIVDNYKNETFPKTDYDSLMKRNDQFSQNIKDKANTIVLDGIGFVAYSIEIELPPEALELVDINSSIQQELINCCILPGGSSDFKLNKEADTISMKSVLTTSTHILLIQN